MSTRPARLQSLRRWWLAELSTSRESGHRKILFQPIFSLTSVPSAGWNSKQGERRSAPLLPDLLLRADACNGVTPLGVRNANSFDNAVSSPSRRSNQKSGSTNEIRHLAIGPCIAFAHRQEGVMRTRKQAAQLVDYWASQHEETADEILASLELYDDQSRNVLTEQLAYLVDDANFLRKQA